MYKNMIVFIFYVNSTGRIPRDLLYQRYL